MWNARAPYRDSVFAKYVNKPELAGLLPVLYPTAFPNLKAYKKPRADLSAILLTGIPEGVVPGFQNFTGPVKADMLRLNVAVPPSKKPNPLGLVARRPCRLPERPTDRRRRRDDRAAGDRRSDDPAGRPVVHAGRRSQPGHGRYDRHQRGAHEGLPLPRPAGRWLPDHARHDEGVMSAPAQVENPFAGQGSVLLDIGGEVGALVVTMPAAMVDVEVEIRPEDGNQDSHAHDHGDGHHTTRTSRSWSGR